MALELPKTKLAVRLLSSYVHYEVHALNGIAVKFLPLAGTGLAPPLAYHMRKTTLK